MPMILYTCNIDVNTGEVERDALDLDDYDEEFAGYAEYDEHEWVGVYAESLVSRADADRLVREMCESLRDKFARAVVLLDVT